MADSIQTVREFRRRYMMELNRCIWKTHADNWATYRFGPFKGSVHIDEYVTWQEFIQDHIADFAWAESRFEDAESRALLVQLLVFRSLGPMKVKLFRNSPLYQQRLARLEADPEGIRILERFLQPLPKKPTHRYQHEGTGIVFEGRPGNLINGWYNDLGRFRRNGLYIGPRAGDHAIEAGAASGVSTLRTAYDVGEQGKVYGFEFLPENLLTFRKHLALNPRLAKRVVVVENPLGKNPADVLYYTPAGHGTVVGATGEVPVKIQSMDGLVADGIAPRIDFMYLDVEGSEIPSLYGAENALRTFKPRIALSAYHKLDDYYSLMRVVDQIQPGYRFYLDHHTIHGEETVIFGFHPDNP